MSFTGNIGGEIVPYRRSIVRFCQDVFAGWQIMKEPGLVKIRYITGPLIGPFGSGDLVHFRAAFTS